MMFKKVLLFVIICNMISISTVFATDVPKPIRVYINGEQLNFTEQPFIENDVTLVQFRPIFEKLGLKIEWNAAIKTITGRSDNLIIKLTIGSDKAIVNDEVKTLVLAPRIVASGNTMIPLRFISEASGKEVEWDNSNRTISINSNSDKNAVVDGSYELKDGSKYVGQQINNLADGQGTFYWTNGDKYTGEFKGGKPDGQGTYLLADGSKYIGYMKNGMKSGSGVFYWLDGKKFIGEFKDDSMNGFGVYYESNGAIISQGNYANDELIVSATPTPSPTITPTPSSSPQATPTPTVTPQPTPSAYATARNTQLLNELATLQQALTNIQNEKNVKLFQDGAFVWVADPAKVTAAQNALQTAQDYYNTWKAIWGF